MVLVYEGHLNFTIRYFQILVKLNQFQRKKKQYIKTEERNRPVLEKEIGRGRKRHISFNCKNLGEAGLM